MYLTFCLNSVLGVLLSVGNIINNQLPLTEELAEGSNQELTRREEYTDGKLKNK